ncbi:MAG: [citrate (pro-3S)-lyase] ligase [Treponema sp.]|nr:[citrate (pro-3S)-lyase] ligase [Treponema sp.]
MEINYGSPFSGERLEKLKSFLTKQGLDYDEQQQFSLCIMDGPKIIATGALDVNVLKCIAVDPAHRNEGLAARIVTELINKAAEQGQYHLFIFTGPENKELFSGLGFYSIAQTKKALLMENKKDGIIDFVSGLQKPDGGKIGAIVANCNPFTKGHLYLIEKAARECDILHLFILSENKSFFSSDLRKELAVNGTAHIPNVIVQPTGPYIISAATFPKYFIKDDAPGGVNAELDLKIFAEHIARPLGISRRYVGTEPNCRLTASYNRKMKETLPQYGIEVVEVPRLEIQSSDHSKAISASSVRNFLLEGAMAEIEALVPPATYRYLLEYGKHS